MSRVEGPGLTAKPQERRTREARWRIIIIEKALRLGAADLSGLEAQSTSHEYEALRETIPKRHRTTSIRKGSEQSMNESRIQE